MLTVIFKAKRMKAQWLIGSPPGTVARVSDNGWITAEIFLEWAKSFINFLLTADGCPHILLLDGHSTHIYNLEFLDLMKANNVHPFIFPPHTTHWLQPADRSFFKSLKNNWNSEGVQAVTRSGGKGFGKQGFFGIFTPAWTKSCTIELAQSGFRACGVFPLNPNAVPDCAFAPSETSERPPAVNQQVWQLGLQLIILAYGANTK